MAKHNRALPVVFLEGPRIYLRPIELSDTQTCQRWFNDPQTRQLLLNVRPLNEAAERKFIEEHASGRNDSVALAIVCRRDDRFIGTVGLIGINWVDRRATFGISIGEKAYRGRGFGTEATRLILKHAFETLNLHRIELDVYDFNLAGIRAYEKAGFTREGVLREHHFGHGRYCDIYRYGILSREYFEQLASGDGAVRRTNQEPARKDRTGRMMR